MAINLVEVGGIDTLGMVFRASDFVVFTIVAMSVGFAPAQAEWGRKGNISIGKNET